MTTEERVARVILEHEFNDWGQCRCGFPALTRSQQARHVASAIVARYTVGSSCISHAEDLRSEAE